MWLTDDPDLWGLILDCASGTYTLFVTPLVTVEMKARDDVRGMLSDLGERQYAWGPEYGQDGSPVAGLPIKDIPIPASGTTLSGTLRYHTRNTLAVFPADWEVTWEIVGQPKP